jgi:hypothetical protein
MREESKVVAKPAWRLSVDGWAVLLALVLALLVRIGLLQHVAW